MGKGKYRNRPCPCDACRGTSTHKKYKNCLLKKQEGFYENKREDGSIYWTPVNISAITPSK